MLALLIACTPTQWAPVQTPNAYEIPCSARGPGLSPGGHAIEALALAADPATGNLRIGWQDPKVELLSLRAWDGAAWTVTADLENDWYATELDLAGGAVARASGMLKHWNGTGWEDIALPQVEGWKVPKPGDPGYTEGFEVEAAADATGRVVLATVAPGRLRLERWQDGAWVVLAEESGWTAGPVSDLELSFDEKGEPLIAWIEAGTVHARATAVVDLGVAADDLALSAETLAAAAPEAVHTWARRDAEWAPQAPVAAKAPRDVAVAGAWLAWSEAGEIQVRRWVAAAWAEAPSPSGGSLAASTHPVVEAGGGIAWLEAVGGGQAVYLKKANDTGWSDLPAACTPRAAPPGRVAGAVPTEPAGAFRLVDTTPTPAMDVVDALGAFRLTIADGALALDGEAIPNSRGARAGRLAKDPEGRPLVAWEADGQLIVARKDADGWKALGSPGSVISLRGLGFLVTPGGLPVLAWLEGAGELTVPHVLALGPEGWKDLGKLLDCVEGNVQLRSIALGQDEAGRIVLAWSAWERRISARATACTWNGETWDKVPHQLTMNRFGTLTDLVPARGGFRIAGEIVLTTGDTVGTWLWNGKAWETDELWGELPSQTGRQLIPGPAGAYAPDLIATPDKTCLGWLQAGDGHDLLGMSCIEH